MPYTRKLFKGVKDISAVIKADGCNSPFSIVVIKLGDRQWIVKTPLLTESLKCRAVLRPNFRAFSELFLVSLHHNMLCRLTNNGEPRDRLARRRVQQQPT